MHTIHSVRCFWTHCCSTFEKIVVIDSSRRHSRTFAITQYTRSLLWIQMTYEFTCQPPSRRTLRHWHRQQSGSTSSTPKSRFLSYLHSEVEIEEKNENVIPRDWVKFHNYQRGTWIHMLKYAQLWGKTLKSTGIDNVHTLSTKSSTCTKLSMSSCFKLSEGRVIWVFEVRYVGLIMMDGLRSAQKMTIIN